MCKNKAAPPLSSLVQSLAAVRLMRGLAPAEVERLLSVSRTHGVFGRRMAGLACSECRSAAAPAAGSRPELLPRRGASHRCRPAYPPLIDLGDGMAMARASAGHAPPCW